MKKRLSFLLVIATLHMLFALAAAGHVRLSGDGGGVMAPLAKLLLCPLAYPLLWNHLVPSFFSAPLLIANSLLWGLMAERLVWGRKRVARRVNAR